MHPAHRLAARLSAVALLVVFGAACAGDSEHPDPPDRDGRAATGGPTATLRGPSVSWAVAQDRLTQHLDSVDTKLRQVSGLTRAERRDLRADVNETQIRSARQYGIRRGADIQALVQQGQLVRLADTTAYWVIRELDYSEPYVTPDTEAMLAEIGRRFHRRLDSLDIPRFRIDITSVLRTPEKQAELRRRNANASRVESAHEFGTTVDLAYRRFMPPVATIDSLAPGLHPQARELADSMVIETARVRGAELQAVLGRVLHEMRREGRLLVMMERSQTVYHITVAARYPERERVQSIADAGAHTE